MESAEFSTARSAFTITFDEQRKTIEVVRFLHTSRAES